MSPLRRGMVIDVNLDPAIGSEHRKVRPCIVITNDMYNAGVPVVQVVPVTRWNEKKSLIVTNVVLDATPENGLVKASIADCLQTRPIDRRHRLVKIRGMLAAEQLRAIDMALHLVFGL